MNVCLITLQCEFQSIFYNRLSFTAIKFLAFPVYILRLTKCKNRQIFWWHPYMEILNPIERCERCINKVKFELDHDLYGKLYFNIWKSRCYLISTSTILLGKKSVTRKVSENYRTERMIFGLYADSKHTG